MQTSILTENDICKKVIIECSATEFLIANKALKQFIENPGIDPIDIQIAKEMAETEIKYVEMEG